MGSFKLRMHQNLDPAGGADNAPPDPLVGWGRGHPLPIPLFLFTPPSPLLLKEIYANAGV